MPRREVPLVAGQYYHVYNRGNNRGPIFFERENYAFFISRFRHHVADQHARVLAYVLMPNHYHFLLQPIDEGLSYAMQRFSISYTKAINERFDRVGCLFQGAFQAKLVDEEGYLLHLTRYLHLNPVRARLCMRPEEWEFSSYRDYVGLRAGTLPDLAPAERELMRAGIPRQEFAARYRSFVLGYRPEDRKRVASLLFP